MIVLGIDPDLHNTGWATVEQLEGSLPVVRAVGVAKVSADHVGADAVVEMSKASYAQAVLAVQIEPDLVVVEGQEIYFAKSNAPPKDLLALGQVAGAWLGLLSHVFPCQIPLPKTWKGSVHKQPHQARVLGKLGEEWKYQKIGSPKTGYCRPTSWPKHLTAPSNKGAWKHIVDGIGLACWGLNQLNQKRRRECLIPSTAKP